MPSFAPIVRIPSALTTALIPMLLCTALPGAGALTAQCELNKLMPAGIAGADRAGAAVGLFGSDLIVGRPGADLPGIDMGGGGGGGADAGSVALYSRSEGGWKELAPFTSPDPAAGDRFGEAVFLGNDVAVIGAPGDDHDGPDVGRVYVFERVAQDWSLVAVLSPPVPTPGAAFGSAVAAYPFNIIVGAPHDDTPSQAGAGAAYIYRRLDGQWLLQERVHSPRPRADGAFGISVSIETDLAIVGAPGDDGTHALVGNAGAAYVYQRQPGGWVQSAGLVAGNGAPGDAFGSSVTLSGLFAAVGAPGHDGGAPASGWVTIFHKASFGWHAQVELPPPAPEAGAAMGARVVMFDNMVAVTAPRGSSSGRPSGEVHLYLRQPGTWIYELTTHASDAANDDGYGLGLSLWDDSLLVGVPDDDDAGRSSGAAFVVQPFGVTSWVDLAIGGSGPMTLTCAGDLCAGSDVTLSLKAAPPGAAAVVIVGTAQIDAPFHGGLLVPRPDLVFAGLAADDAGRLKLVAPLPIGVPSGLSIFVQAWVADASAPDGVAGSNAMSGLSP